MLNDSNRRFLTEMQRAKLRDPIIRICISIISWVLIVTVGYYSRCDGLVAAPDIPTKVPEIMVQCAEDGELISLETVQGPFTAEFSETIPTDKDGILFVSGVLHAGEQQYTCYVGLTKLPLLNYYVYQSYVYHGSAQGSYGVNTMLHEYDFVFTQGTMYLTDSHLHYRAYSIIIFLAMAILSCFLRSKLWIEQS